MIRLEDWEGNFFTAVADDFTVDDNTTNYKIDFTDVHADDGKNSSLQIFFLYNTFAIAFSLS